MSTVSPIAVQFLAFSNNDLKIGILTPQLVCLSLNLRDSEENMPRAYLLCGWERHLVGLALLLLSDGQVAGK